MGPDGAYLYADVRNNPINGRDPLRLFDLGTIGRTFQFKVGGGLEASAGIKLGPAKVNTGVGASWVAKCDLGGGHGSSIESEAGAGAKWSSYAAGAAVRNESSFYTNTLDGSPDVIDQTDEVFGVKKGDVGATNNLTIGADAGLLAKFGFSIDLKKLFVDGLFGDGDEHACK